jgi:hypothetical protein
MFYEQFKALLKMYTTGDRTNHNNFIFKHPAVPLIAGTCPPFPSLHIPPSEGRPMRRRNPLPAEAPARRRPRALVCGLCLLPPTPLHSTDNDGGGRRAACVRWPRTPAGYRVSDAV